MTKPNWPNFSIQPIIFKTWVFTEEPFVILQWNNSLEFSYLSILLASSNNSLCIIIIWASIFSCCLWSSGDILANITHAVCSSSSTLRWCSFLTSSSASLARAFEIGFSRIYNFFFLAWEQFSHFGVNPRNLVQSIC